MIPLQAEVRAADIASKLLRRNSKVPIVLYGNDVENTILQCDYSDLFRVYVKAGESVLVELDAGGKKVPVLFHAVQFEPVSDRITHVDFYAVDMKKEIEARVPVIFIDESLAVKDLGGVLVTVLDHVTVKCLPSDLPQNLEVSIEKLETFADSLTVADLTIPDNVIVQEAPEAMIATVQEPRREEEPVVAEVEGEEGEAVEGEEGEVVEGEEAAAEGEGEKAEGEGEKKEEGGKETSE